MAATEETTYWITRAVFQRSLGFIYFLGFLIVVNQFIPLCGAKGLLPARLFVQRVRFWDSPSLFWLNSSDRAFLACGAVGLALSIAAMAGVTERFSNWVSAGCWFLLWALYLSFVNVGQTFYSFGWETLLLETGFLAIFLGSAKSPPSVLVIWLLRWVLFRMMFGAGMIKVRGDSCWRDLTCLQYHYETQPMPNPLSWYFHNLPVWMLKSGVLTNHIVELIVPFGFFGPRMLRHGAGILTILFEVILILSGNLSWLNYMTIVVAIACFDDSFFQWILFSVWPEFPHWSATLPGVPTYVLIALAVLISVLSIRPVINLFSSEQIMNTSFEPFHLVNTYGAFGSITRVRSEVILEGTEDTAITPATKWKEYEFKGKPGDPYFRPPQIAPYHLRLDWLMWFAAMGNYQQYPWIINLVAKLLQNDPAVVGLIRTNPFPQAPPHFIRARLYTYRFTPPGDKSGRWWDRTLTDEYLPALSMDNPNFAAVLQRQGWD